METAPVYVLVVGLAMFDDIYYQWDLDKYDLNQDGQAADLKRGSKDEYNT